MQTTQGLKIVIADDDELNLMILNKILTDASHIVTEFPDGHLAWDYIKNNPDKIDMVILDKMMVQMHGTEVVQLMKASDVYKDIPIIFQSGDIFPDQIKKSIDLGIDRYMTKPFEDYELIEMIDELVKDLKITPKK